MGTSHTRQEYHGFGDRADRCQTSNVSTSSPRCMHHHQVFTNARVKSQGCCFNGRLYWVCSLCCPQCTTQCTQCIHYVVHNAQCRTCYSLCDHCSKSLERQPTHPPTCSSLTTARLPATTHAVLHTGTGKQRADMHACVFVPHTVCQSARACVEDEKHTSTATHDPVKDLHAHTCHNEKCAACSRGSPSCMHTTHSPKGRQHMWNAVMCNGAIACCHAHRSRRAAQKMHEFKAGKDI